MEHTVPLTMTLRTEHADLGSLERAVDAALVEAGRALWAELVRLLEATLPLPGDCPCGGRFKANGRAPRRLVTLAGEGDLHRRRFRCRACGAEVVSLDRALGLEPRIAHSLGVRERALWLVTELSYAKTAATLDELRGLPVSHGELHQTGWRPRAPGSKRPSPPRPRRSWATSRPGRRPPGPRATCGSRPTARWSTVGRQPAQASLARRALPCGQATMT